MIAVISDVHANADALRPVLADIRKVNPESIICLGDLVGYNTLVQETLSLIREAKIPSVHGNHDLMALGRIEINGCGSWAAQAVQWTQRVLTAEQRKYLASLPGAFRLRHDLLFVHSCLGDPVRRLQTPHEYVQQYRLLRYYDSNLRICFTGHTHIPRIIEITRDDRARLRTEDDLELQPECFYFVNPGSVGHPRGEDRRASYVLYDPDTDRVTLRRVAYRGTRVARENAKYGLPVSEDAVGPGHPQPPADRSSWSEPARAAVRAIAERLSHVGK